MKTSPVSIITTVVLIASLLGGVCMGGAQDKPKGLLGAFSGEDDPSKDRSPKPAEDTKAKKPVQPKKPAPDVIYSPPDPKALDKRIKQLEGLNYDNIKHAPDLEKAKQRINDLRQRARRLRLRNDNETAATVKALADHKKRMEERWLKLAATLKDGKKRTAQEWAEIANGVFGPGQEIELPADDPAKDADDAIGVPTPDELDSDEGDDPAAEDATDPLEPPKAPKTKIETAPPKLEDLIETMKGQEKPEGMHPVT